MAPLWEGPSSASSPCSTRPPSPPPRRPHPGVPHSRSAAKSLASTPAPRPSAPPVDARLKLRVVLPSPLWNELRNNVTVRYVTARCKLDTLEPRVSFRHLRYLTSSRVARHVSRGGSSRGRIRRGALVRRRWRRHRGIDSSGSSPNVLVGRGRIDGQQDPVDVRRARRRGDCDRLRGGAIAREAEPDSRGEAKPRANPGQIHG